MPPPDDLPKLEAIAQAREIDSRNAVRRLLAFGDQELLPAAERLSEICEFERDRINDAVKAAVATSKTRVDAAVGGTEQLESSMTDALAERAELTRRLAATANPQERRRLQRLIRRRDAALDAGLKRFKVAQRHVDSEIEAMKDELTVIEPIWKTVKSTLAAAYRAQFRLTLARVGPLVVRVSFIALALGMTFLVDRYTPLLETVARDAGARSAHDAVVLIVFALEIVAIEPLIDRVRTALNWRTYDGVLGVVRRLAGELVESGEKMSRVTSSVTALVSRTSRSA